MFLVEDANHTKYFNIMKAICKQYWLIILDQIKQGFKMDYNKKTDFISNMLQIQRCYNR